MADSLADLADKIEDMADEVEDKANDSVAATRKQVRQDAENNLSSGTTPTRATGRLKQSMDDGATQLSPQVRRHFVVARADYAKYVEYGTGVKNDGVKPTHRFPSPSHPPRDAIRDWIETKGIEPRQYDSVYGLTEAIAQEIEESGTEPHPFMRPALYMNEDVVVGGVRGSLQVAVRHSMR